MAGGSTAPTEITDGTSHINPTYDSDEDGQVEAADDADKLDGQDATYYETPTSTQPASQTGGYVPLGGVTTDENNSVSANIDVYAVADGAETWIDTCCPDHSVEIRDQDNNLLGSTGYSDTRTRTYNWSEQYIETLEITLPSSQYSGYTVELRPHIISVGTHSHNI